MFEAGGVKYRLRGTLGDGAVGLVRKAEDRSTRRIVAVKFLAPDPKYIEMSAFDDVASRFRREGMRGLGLDHEHLVKLIAYEDNNDGTCFESRRVKNPLLVMEYVRGSTLESLIRRMDFAPPGRVAITEQKLAIAAAIAEALKYLHGHKLVHRDLKPANVFLSTGTVGALPSLVKLGDFGVTKWGDFRAAVATGTLTMSHQQGLGTLKYMSPEQAVRPKEVSVRSDMFSLGITLFELFTGWILPSPHHVFEIMSARTSRNSITGKLHALGVTCSSWDEGVFELVLDMFLTGERGRPTSVKVAGNLKYRLSQMREARQRAEEG
jgi:serine/threonine protein kinase